jgi:PAS domain S-box-containing protein
MKNIDTQGDLDLFFQIFNTLATPLFVKNEEHRFIMLNDAFCKQFGINRDEIVGKTDDELFPENEWKIFREKDNAILKTGIPTENEENATISGRKKLRVLTRKSILRSRNGKKYILGVITDITEKTRLLEKVRESENKYKIIFNLGSDPAGLFQYPERIAVEVNDAFLEIGGVSRKSVIGKKATHAFTWVDTEEREHYIRVLEKKKEVRNMEIRLRNHKGHLMVFLVSAKMLRIRKQNHVLYSLRDITELKMAESALRESELMYREMVEHSPVPLFIQQGGVVVYANDAATSFTRVPLEKFIGKKIGEVINIPGIKRKGKGLQSIFQEPTHTWESKDIRLESTDGIPTNILLRNVRIKYGGSDAIMSMVLDITERQNLEKYIINRIIKAEEDERERFAADLHDDLGPTLSTVKFQLGALERSKDPIKVQQGLENLESLLNEVIRKVHQISHSISPHVIGDFGLVSALSDFCRRFGEDQRFRILFTNNVENIRFPKDIELHMYRIILELLNNSMKHSGSKVMCINLHYRQGYLILRYHDEGKGYSVRETMNNSSGMGIPNIINRVSLINGDVRFTKVKGKTVVVIKTLVNLDKINLSDYSH